MEIEFPFVPLGSFRLWTWHDVLNLYVGSHLQNRNDRISFHRRPSHNPSHYGWRLIRFMVAKTRKVNVPITCFSNLNYALLVICSANPNPNLLNNDDDVGSNCTLFISCLMVMPPPLKKSDWNHNHHRTIIPRRGLFGEEFMGPPSMTLDPFQFPLHMHLFH